MTATVPPDADSPVARWKERVLLVGDQGWTSPGQGFLLEVSRILDPVEDIRNDAKERRNGRDDERPADLPVNAWHGPQCVVVLGCDVVIEPDAPATEEVEHQGARHRQDALHPRFRALLVRFL